VRVITEVIRAGATTVNIPDTVGYATPQEMHDLIVYLREQVPNIDQAEISVHCHNDLGMAVANSLGGVLGGATQVEVAINGIGERAGNAALEEVVMALKTRADSYNAVTRVDSSQIHRASRLIYNIIGQAAPLNKAIVGSNAFLHEAGIHQHGVLANRATYEIMTPESVGIQTSSMVLGKHSGSHAFEARLKELGHSFTADEIKEFFERFKEVADKKKVVTDSDIEAIVTNRVRAENHHFKLETFNVHSGRSEKSSAMGFIRLSRQGQIYQEISLGDGPVDAAFGAIDKIIQAPEHELETYLIQSTSDGADSLGEAVIRLRSGDKLISGRGLSTDVIESSILAYLNAMNKLTT
jgi:2-isopropylmalate synthase